MKNNLLVERFQKLAGIKPLYGGENVKKLKEGPYPPDEQNAHLDESNGALSSQVEAWLVEEIKGHNASEQSINGEFELGITKRYYGHDPMALKLMGEMEQLGEITINIKASDVYHDDIEDIKVLSVESDYVVVKWGTYVSDDEDEWIEA